MNEMYRETIDEVRERILRRITGKDRQLKAFEKYNKPGIANKLLMWAFAPAYYTPYPVAKFLSRFKQNKPSDVSDVASVGGPSEIKLTKFLVKNLKGSDVFYDIGANHGFYTLLALNFCETHSFEPLPDVFVDLTAASKKRERQLNHVGRPASPP